jgi:hypothetical protein
MAAVPSDADAIAGVPSDNAVAERIDRPGDFVAGDARILDRPNVLHRNRVAMANPAGLDANAHPSGRGIGKGEFRELEPSIAGTWDASCLHR